MSRLPPPYRRHRRRKYNSLLGLWIGLGVFGGLFFLLLLVLLIVHSTNDSPSSSQNIAGPSNEGMNLFGLDSSQELEPFDTSEVDDGSPILIYRPTFFQNHRGIPVLRMEYEIKDSNRIFDSYLTVVFESEPGHPSRILFRAPMTVARSSLEDRGTLNLPVASVLGFHPGTELPDGRLSWRIDFNRVSNQLVVPMPADFSNLPRLPRDPAATRPRGPFQVRLENPQYARGGWGDLHVDLVPMRGSPEPQTRYTLICDERRGGRPELHDVSLVTETLDQTTSVAVNIRKSFRSDGTYTLRLLATSGRPAKSRVISNVLTVPGPRNR